MADGEPDGVTDGGADATALGAGVSCGIGSADTVMSGAGIGAIVGLPSGPYTVWVSACG